jgi:hypothetical protein
MQPMHARVEEAQDRMRLVRRHPDEGRHPAELGGPRQILQVARAKSAVLAVEHEEVPTQHRHVFGQRRFGVPDEATEDRLALGQLRLRCILQHGGPSLSRAAG